MGEKETEAQRDEVTCQDHNLSKGRSQDQSVFIPIILSSKKKKKISDLFVLRAENMEGKIFFKFLWFLLPSDQCVYHVYYTAWFDMIQLGNE